MSEVTTTQYSYSVVFRDEKWGVMVEDDQGTPPWLLSWKATEDELWATVRYLRTIRSPRPTALPSMEDRWF